MEKKNRYILNMGLAFDEDGAMKKLSQMAKEGWILEEMSLFKYKLVKFQPKEIDYSMDYKELSENDNEYFQLFESSGWQHICSYGAFHFFAATPGTVPIYTDKENYLSKYKSSKHGYKKAAIISLAMIVVIILIKFLLGNRIEGIIIKNVMFIIFTISLVIATPSVMVSVAFYIKDKRILKKILK